MKYYIFMAALLSFFSAGMEFFVGGGWFGALGWVLVGVYQLRDAFMWTR
jgi:hypothetical protein